MPASTGTAKSKELNTVWRQASFVAAMLGQYIADKSGQDVLDNGDLAALQAKFVAALAASPAFTGTPTAPTPAAGDKSGKLATTAFVAGNFPRVCSIGALPTQDIGPIIVAECSEVWTWVSTQYYTGYRSPLCARPVDGHTVTPLASEVDAVGGELSKTDYARLWGYARENNLVVSDAVWTANRGAHYFADVSGTTFRCRICGICSGGIRGLTLTLQMREWPVVGRLRAWKITNTSHQGIRNSQCCTQVAVPALAPALATRSMARCRPAP
ncbi:hypothetical protein WJ970_29945 [Achromobacter xylosoxidans]